MSINVTVNGNPISIRRGKMVLSDLENLKKTEREYRKRLRLEQVQEQSKAISKRLLERAKQIKQDELERLEQNKNTAMRRAHDQKLMELHSRYQDIENIGYAHKNAARQPDIDCVMEAEERKNREKAKERGLEASERLKEAQKKISPHTKHVERLRSVRELENERSNLVSHLPKRSSNVSQIVSKSSNSKLKNVKYVLSKKTPIKKPKITSKTPSKTSASILKDKTTADGEFNNVNDLSNTNVCESDEPRKSVPKFTTENKSKNLITSATASSSSISDDSSYFSDNSTKFAAVKDAATHTSSLTSKVTSYDHETRHKHTYERPSGLVERIDTKNQPSANDLAQNIINSENKISSVVTSQEETSNQRCQDALLREKIRRDYEILLKKLEQLSKKEKKYEGEQCSNTNERFYAPSKRSDDLAKRQQKMDRVFKNILQTSRQSCNTELIDRAERPITIPPRDQPRSKPLSSSCWKELFDEEDTDESSLECDNEYTRKRKISELLIKIEKMKQKLLQEYGTDLPENIFNASNNSLFKNQPISSCQERLERKPGKTRLVPKPKPKEGKNVKILGNNLCDKIMAKPHKIDAKTKSSCCQTSVKNTQTIKKSTVSTCDQEVQVELKQTKADKEVETEKQYPIEPLVKIVQPNNIDSVSSSSLCSTNSSVSTDVVIGVSKKELTIISKDKKSSMKVSKNTTAVSSIHQTTSKTPVKICFDGKNGNESYQIAGLVIDTSMKEITVIPKKNKSLTEIRQDSPVITGSCHSLPGSRANTPSKKQSTSAPPSRHSSPKKSPHLHQYAKKRASVKERNYKTQYTQVSNSSTESSAQNNSSGTSNFCKFQALASKRIITHFQDSSDASTAYPSPLTHGILNASDNTNTILEFLDSSTNESLKKKLNDASPVSSPETPSPRTMMVPSNIPKSSKASKCLKFSSFLNTQTSSSARSCATSRNKQSSTSRSTTQTSSCTCKNPECKLFHDKTDDTQAQVLKYCPEVLKKYEKMQSICAGRIASLTDLIQKVRNEQKGLDFSIVTNEGSQSTSQIISSTQFSSNNDININEIVKKMESVSAQVKKTLMDSRQIISGEDVILCEPSKLNKDKSLTLSKNTSSMSESPEEKQDKNRRKSTNAAPSNKPKILNDERVNIKLDRYQSALKPKRMSGGSDDIKTTMTSVEVVAAAGLASSNSDQNEEMVKMLSKEILEQSKSINKSPIDNIKNSDDCSLKSSQAVVKDIEESSKNDVENQENNPPEILNGNTLDFIPFLAGIPKMTRAKGSGSTRGRPPVTLISGPYRQEMDLESAAHELSTIVEFDTPDTAKKSQVSTRSPSNKVRKKLPTPESHQLITSPKTTDLKVTKSKPSVHVAPLPAHISPQLSLNLSNKSGAKSFEKSPRNSSKKSTEKSSEILEHKKSLKTILKKNSSSDSMHSLPDVLIENLQASRENTDANFDFPINQISELHSLPDENIDQILVSGVFEESTLKPTTTLLKPNQEASNEVKLDQNKENNKISTSSSSFSGLSGISEISTTPSSDAVNFKCPSSPEEMEQALKKWGLGWATTTLKKTREASALGSSSSSDGTPVNTGTRLVSPVKKYHQDNLTPKELPDLSDVSSISIKHANKSTERSVLVKGRTSTPNGLEKNKTSNNFSNSNTNETVSSLGSFSSDLNIVVQNQSAEMTVPNISFSQSNL